MSYVRTGVRAFLLAGTLSLAPGIALSADEQPQVKLEARLFNSATGQLSPDVLGPEPAPLINIPASEQPSNSTLVVVHIVNDQLLPAETKVRLIAQETGAASGAAETILDQETAVKAQAASKRDFYVGFWLPQTGCASIKLNAALVTGGDKDATAEANLDFICQE